MSSKLDSFRMTATFFFFKVFLLFWGVARAVSSPSTTQYSFWAAPPFLFDRCFVAENFMLQHAQKLKIFLFFFQCILTLLCHFYNVNRQHIQDLLGRLCSMDLALNASSYVTADRLFQNVNVKFTFYTHGHIHGQIQLLEMCFFACW